MPYYGLLKFDPMHFLNPALQTVKDHAIRLAFVVHMRVGALQIR